MLFWTAYNNFPAFISKRFYLLLARLGSNHSVSDWLYCQLYLQCHYCLKIKESSYYGLWIESTLHYVMFRYWRIKFYMCKEMSISTKFG